MSLVSHGTATATVKVYVATGDLHSVNYGNFTTDPTMALTAKPAVVESPFLNQFKSMPVRLHG